MGGFEREGAEVVAEKRGWQRLLGLGGSREKKGSGLGKKNMTGGVHLSVREKKEKVVEKGATVGLVQRLTLGYFLGLAQKATQTLFFCSYSFSIFSILICVI
jgi:hypothetical protein